MQFLRASTATTLKMGPAVDKTDGVTPETALTPTVYLSKNGGSFTARSSATAITHDRDGYYNVPVDTTDTNTVGRCDAEFTDAATHLPVRERFIVLPQPIFDWFLGSETLQVDAATIAPSALDTTSLTAGALNAIAQQVVTAAIDTPLHVDVREVANVAIQGSGTSGDPWRPV